MCKPEKWRQGVGEEAECFALPLLLCRDKQLRGRHVRNEFEAYCPEL